MNREWFLADPAATDALATRLAQTLPERAVLFLRGDLGAGKSSLARGMLRALGVSGAIKSPTYTLIERYALDRGEAAHLDLYRIAQANELEFLGLQDLAPELRLWLVEWPERGQGALPRPDIELDLRIQGEGRQARLQAHSEVGQAWLAALARTPGEGGLERSS
jgi:tRNA threonylcarbamoyladenosine biosynthesis protein TsaE